MAEQATPVEEPRDLIEVEIPDSLEEAALESNDTGQGLVEYGLIIFLVAIVVIAILLLVGPRIGSIFSRITSLG